MEVEIERKYPDEDDEKALLNLARFLIELSARLLKNPPK